MSNEMTAESIHAAMSRIKSGLRAHADEGIIPLAESGDWAALAHHTQTVWKLVYATIAVTSAARRS